MTDITPGQDVVRRNDGQAPTTEVTSANADVLLRNTGFFFKLLCKAGERLAYGSIVLNLPDGRRLRFNSGVENQECAIVNIHDYTFARRTLLGGTIGFYESFANNEWSSPDLAETLYVFARNADEIQKLFLAHPVLRFINNVAHGMNRNTKSGSRKNIMAHYDLGNEFYEKWLDKTMTYSSALFTTADQPLDVAQEQKYASLARQISLKNDETLLEIGSGWGGFAEFAAREVGANVTGVTISPEQYRYAKERMFREGLNEKVEIRLQDYRDVEEKFDKIASIEMFEAVGREYWPTYFSKVRDSLNDSGLAGLQVITIADRFYENYVKAADFIQKYVFPGGMLPSPEVFDRYADKSGLLVRDTLSFGQDYARTLNQWHSRFLEVWDDLIHLGFDDRFKKLWQFYLAYCEAGFRAETTDVRQVVLAKA